MTDLRLSEQQDAVVLAAQAISQDLAQAHEAMGWLKLSVLCKNSQRLRIGSSRLRAAVY